MIKIVINDERFHELRENPGLYTAKTASQGMEAPVIASSAEKEVIFALIFSTGSIILARIKIYRVYTKKMEARERKGKMDSIGKTPKSGKQISLPGKLARTGVICGILGGLLSSCATSNDHHSPQLLTPDLSPAVTEINPGENLAIGTSEIAVIPEAKAETPAPEPNWSLEIPKTPEECTNVIRDDTNEHTEADIASLNEKIMEHKWFADYPVGEFPPRTQQLTIKPWDKPDAGGIIPYPDARIEIWYNAYNADGSPIDAVVTSCSKYKDGYLIGTFMEVNKQIIPVQIFMEPEILQNYVIDYSKHGQDPRPFLQRLFEDYQLRDSKTWASSIELFGEFGDYTKYQNSETAKLGEYLEKTYNYSERIKRLLTGLADQTEAQETIEIMKNNPLPGYVRLNQQ